MDNNSKGEKNIIVQFIGKICISIGIFFAVAIAFLIISFNYDGNWNSTVAVYCMLIIYIFLLFIVFGKKYKKIIIVLLIVATSILIINHIYYRFFSMSVESQYYLHNKYNFSYSDMKVIRTEMSSWGMLGGGTERSAIVKYKDYEIKTHYDSREKKWKDDYDVNIKNGTKKEEYLNIVKSILSEDNDNENYKVYTKLTTGNRYSYAIYLYTNDSKNVSNVIKKLDNYVPSYDVDGMHYTIYIVKDKNIYDILSNAKINKKYSNDLFPYSIFKSIGYKSKIISDDDYYKEEFFSDDGNKRSYGYRHIDSYEYIVFTYEDRGYGPRCYVYGLLK